MSHILGVALFAFAVFWIVLGGVRLIPGRAPLDRRSAMIVLFAAAAGVAAGAAVATVHRMSLFGGAE